MVSSVISLLSPFCVGSTAEHHCTLCQVIFSWLSFSYALHLLLYCQLECLGGILCGDRDQEFDGDT